MKRVRGESICLTLIDLVSVLSVVVEQVIEGASQRGISHVSTPSVIWIGQTEARCASVCSPRGSLGACRLDLAAFLQEGFFFSEGGLKEAGHANNF